MVKRRKDITRFKESKELENKFIKLIKRGKITEEDLSIIKAIFDKSKNEDYKASQERRRRAVDEAELRAQKEEVPLETRRVLLESAFKGEKIIEASRQLKEKQKEIAERVKETPEEKREEQLRRELAEIRQAKKKAREEEEYLIYSELEKDVEKALKMAKRLNKEEKQVEVKPEQKEAEKIRKRYFKTSGYLDDDMRAIKTMNAMRKVAEKTKKITPEIAKVIKKEAEKAGISTNLLLAVIKEKRQLTKEEEELLK